MFISCLCLKVARFTVEKPHVLITEGTWNFNLSYLRGVDFFPTTGSPSLHNSREHILPDFVYISVITNPIFVCGSQVREFSSPIYNIYISGEKPLSHPDMGRLHRNQLRLFSKFRL